MNRIVIAGGGVAGLEGMIAVRRHLGPGPRIDVLEPAMDLIERQLSVAEPFGGPPSPAFDLVKIAADHRAILRPDRLRAVEPSERRLLTVRGDTLHYDALLVAVGARTDVAVAGALTFTGPRAVHAFAKLLDDLAERRVRSVAFAVPPGVVWPLPLYELALMTAEHLHERGVDDARLVLVTPERDPLDLFGARLASRIRALLAQRRIALRTEAIPRRVGAQGLELDDRDPVAVERVVALPRLGGPWLAGLPYDTQGFIPTDEHGAVPGVEAVWAAGDGTAFPIKQGGIAAQQADVAAEAIAAYLGASIDPQPFRPVLRGMLLDPRGARFLQPDASEPSETPLWWPPTKVAAQHLAPYLSGAPDDGEQEDDDVVDVGQLLLALAARHEALGDRELAVRCLDAAEQVRGGLEPDTAAWRRELASS